jgi:Aspartyl/Asparaginyl beta-hydroxylase
VLSTELFEILDKLKSIPHLRLGKSFDLSRILKEYESIPDEDFHTYESTAYIDEVRETIERNWKGCSLLSSNGQTSGDLIEGPKLLKNLITSAGKKCPYMMEVISELGDRNECVARIMKIKSGGQLSWHSHAYDYGVGKGSKNLMTIHVPIISPPKFKYSVMSLRDNRLTDLELEKPKIYSKWYNPGEAWLFNSYHMHNVYNYDDHDRVSLMLYLNMHNEKTYKIVSEAVKNYSGELIPSR